MKQRGQQYRKMAINILIAITLSLVLNFSYLVFIMVGSNREPSPTTPSKPRTEQVVEEKVSDVAEESIKSSDMVADSLRREVVIREENITRHSRGHTHISPLATQKGQVFMILDIFFYWLVAMCLLTIMTNTTQRRLNRFTTRLILGLALLIVIYFLSPQMTWRGDIIVTANARHLFNPMTVLKLTALFLVCALYGKIFELLYAKQVVEMENERLKNENLSWQYNTLVNQVNPHFLFNSLNSLSMLVREQKNDDAVTYIGQMSDTYRYIIEKGKVEKTTVENELRFLEAYGYLLEIRYAGKLNVKVDVGEEFFECEIPPLSIQPLIENAVKHNTITSSRPMTITITAEENHIVVSNPITPKLQPEESTGIGLTNLSSRYELIVGRKIEVLNDGKVFTVKLPIICATK